MKIAIIVPLDERVPPPRYGGIELVIYNLIQELVALGHDVTLLASADSQTKASLLPICEVALRTQPEYRHPVTVQVRRLQGLSKAISHLRKHQFDIVHNHMGWSVPIFEELVPAPLVTTVHGSLYIPHEQVAYGSSPQTAYVSISLNQRLGLPSLNFVANVYNGIDTKIFQFFPKGKEYFAFLGRMSPEKGPAEAITIAKKAGVRLVMAAKVDTIDEEYFNTRVKPLIDGEQIKFIGEVDHAGKVELLGNAMGLLAPIQWEEPFGLYYIEAMICGTPVITMRRGSAPEIIIDKKTGFLCDTLEEAIAATGKISTLERHDCHEHAQRNFSAEIMAKRYVAAYEQILHENN